MIRLLKAFADWLDRRYPPNIKLNWDIYNKQLTRLDNLDNKIGRYGTLFEGYDYRIKELESSIKAIKDLLAKNGANILKPEAQRLRDEFVTNPERFQLTGKNAT